jgi:uncharacterized phage protein (TIGR01671 family)
MSREIKFRAWEKDYGIDTEHMSMRGVGINDYGEAYADKGVILMQYIGLKDKNGVDAYESDIISDGVDWYVIEYDVRGTRFTKFWKGQINENVSSGLYNMESYEVIGNIYENPELLS